MSALENALSAIHDEVDRRERTKLVITWLAETCGEDVADMWCWEHTPMPCGLPSDTQLAQGLEWAALGRDRALPLMAAAREAYEREMSEAMLKEQDDG